MPRFNSTRETIGSYPTWATDANKRGKVDAVTRRLIELAYDYHAGTLKSNAAAARFISELLDALHTDNPATLHPLIDSYHIKPEFDLLLRIADSIRHGEDVSEQLAVEARNIKFSSTGNKSKERAKIDHDAINQEANKLKSLNPRLSDREIARRIESQFPQKASTIRNILNKNRIR
jgi:hypothetical protein